MRDHNTIYVSGHLKDTPVPFGEGTEAGCRFTLVTRDEWRTSDGSQGERTDFLGIVCYGPTRDRAQILQKGDRVLITGRLRNNLPTEEEKLRKTQIDARTIETLRTIHPAKA